MAFCVINRYPGVTGEQLLAGVNQITGGVMPPTVQSTIFASDDDGAIAVVVWNSKDDFDAFITDYQAKLASVGLPQPQQSTRLTVTDTYHRAAGDNNSQLPASSNSGPDSSAVASG